MQGLIFPPLSGIDYGLHSISASVMMPFAIPMATELVLIPGLGLYSMHLGFGTAGMAIGASMPGTC